MTPGAVLQIPARALVRAIIVAILIAIGDGSVTGAGAEPLPRVAHLAQALVAVRALGPAGRDQLDRAIYAMTRAQCHSDNGTPVASCLVAAARAVCAAAPDRPRCVAAADVIAANLRAAATWVDEATRFRLIRGSADYHAALAAELHRRYAALAAELVLGAEASPPDPRGGDPGGHREAFAIDQLCARRDRAIHACEPGAAACVPSLPWSRCAAALIWFIGGGR